MIESKYKWIPTIYHVKVQDDGFYNVEQKSYINDLFIENIHLKKQIEELITTVFGYTFSLFSRLADIMNLGCNYLYDKDLRVIVKSSYYILLSR